MDPSLDRTLVTRRNDAADRRWLQRRRGRSGRQEVKFTNHNDATTPPTSELQGISDNWLKSPILMQMVFSTK